MGAAAGWGSAASDFVGEAGSDDAGGKGEKADARDRDDRAEESAERRHRIHIAVADGRQRGDRPPQTEGDSFY